MSDPRADRPFDLILHGATSFVGQIICEYLVHRVGTEGPFRWAISGRDAAKLERVAVATGADVERFVADAADRSALDDLVGRTRVVATTVGPYARYGSELVAAAVAAGTDVCDLTGETQWMRRMIDQHQPDAERSGARIVHACGFDSVPSDLGVWFLQQQAMERFGVPCTTVSMRVRSMRGGASGGTVASMFGVMEEATSDPEVRRVLADPYALAPPDLRQGPRQTEHVGPGHDRVARRWIAPFVMAGVNTRVVHRSHALMGRPWGPEFRYDEALETGVGPLGALGAAGVSAGMAGAMGALAFGPTRRLLAKVVPQPGDGPDEGARERGSFELRFTGTTADGRQLRTRVTGDRDPGYGSTAKMFGEAAMELAGTDHDLVGGGFWTPSTAFGERLVERLEAHAGLRFEVLGEP